MKNREQREQNKENREQNKLQTNKIQHTAICIGGGMKSTYINMECAPTHEEQNLMLHFLV